MPVNVILTRTMAGVLGDTVSEQPSQSDRFPAMRFHPTLPPVTVANEEEEKALPDGYRAKVWEEAEAEAWTAQHARQAPSHEAPSEPSGEEPTPPRSRR